MSDGVESRTVNGRGVAVVTGAVGQDGRYLIERLLDDGWTVHAVDLPGALFPTEAAVGQAGHLECHPLDLLNLGQVEELLASVRPDEIYNLGGVSSVARSFADPFLTWRTNADAVVGLLEIVRLRCPHARFYQASSTDMFGADADGVMVHDENSVLRPQSPYAAAKAAAHVLCGVYRDAYGLRITRGILSNHESRRRGANFLSRKLVDHVVRLGRMSASELGTATPLSVGDLRVQRDWGFAPDYVDGMIRMIRQIEVRAAALRRPPEEDVGRNYRDYLLGTGSLHAVWQLVDSAFHLGGFELVWEREAADVRHWCARFRSSGLLAVVVDPTLIRPADPRAIVADASRARRELGWSPRVGLEPFLTDMLAAG